MLARVAVGLGSAGFTVWDIMSCTLLYRDQSVVCTDLCNRFTGRQVDYSE